MTEIRINVRPIILVLYFVTLSLILLLATQFIPSGLAKFIQYLYVFSILFIPGFLILNIIEKKGGDFTTTILFSLGLSIFSITFVCILSNTILPIFNVTPINEENLLISYLLAFSLFICPLSIKKIKRVSIPIRYDITSILLGLLLILMTLIGTLLLETDNTLILLSFSLFSILPILIHFKVIKEAFPFMIWAFSLSLVMYNSIFGEYPRATDNIAEVFTINEFVLKHKIWEQIAPSNILAMPNVVLLVPFLSFFTGGLFSTFKHIIPFVASFIPVAVYKLAEIKYGSRFAFYSAYFFSSLFNYFTWSSITAKMAFAGLFLGLLGIIILRNDFKERLLLVIFAVCLIFSHYGVAAIFAIGLILSSPLLLLLPYRSSLKNFVILYVTMFYAYSMYATKGSIFKSVNLTIINTLRGIEDILSPKNYGSELLLAQVPAYLEILKFLYIIAFVFGVIEVLHILLKRRETIDEYFVISCALFALIPIPYIFPGQYGGGRAWFIPCILASPFIIAGLVKAGKFLEFKGLIVVFMILFFMFNSGLAAEVFWKHNVGASIYVSYPRIIKSGDIWEREYLDRVTLNGKDLVSGFWLSHHIHNTIIYADRNTIGKLYFAGISRGDVRNKMGSKPYSHLLQRDKNLKVDSYLYLSKFNTENRLIKVSGRLRPELIPVNEVINVDISKIYTNSGSEIYYR